MKISFLIPAMVLYIVRESLCYDLQVGTVLFTKADLVRKCWTESDKALLRARLVMQDVLPDPRCIDFSKPRAVSVILDYINACFHIISTSTYGRLQNMMYLALADAVGGYLRAYVLPLTKKSYYAGLVSYEDACKVFTFYDEIREYLKTNGVGWAQPQKVVFKNIKVAPLDIIGGNSEACKLLYTIEKKGKLHCINTKCFPKSSKLPDLKIKEMPRGTTTEREFKVSTGNIQPTKPPTLPPQTTASGTTLSTPTTSRVSSKVKGSKSHLRETIDKVEFPKEVKNVSSTEKPLKHLGELHIENGTVEDLTKDSDEKRKIRCDCCERKKPECKVKTPKRIIIPLPILDDECDPHTIAVPFRKRPLRNLWRKTSAFILEHYYVAVLQCLISKGNTRSDIKNFNSQFHSWLTSQVYPRLEDERWYPAFGGILRITETIKRFGAEAKLNEPMSHDIAFMFRKGIGFDYRDDEEKPNIKSKGKVKDKTRDIGDIEYYYPTKTRRYYVLAILITVSVWLIVFCGCAFLCLGVRGKRCCSDESGKSGESFCPPTSPSRGCQSCLPEKKAVSFQFLVRFFKKNEEQQNWQLFNIPDENFAKKKLLDDSNILEMKESKKKLTFRHPEGGYHMMSSGGDVPDLFVSDFRNNEKPWACVPTFPVPEIELEKKVENSPCEDHVRMCSTPQVERPKMIQTLWKNPFLWSANVTRAKGGNTKKKDWFKLASRRKRSGTSGSGSIWRSTNGNEPPRPNSENCSKTSTDKKTTSYSYGDGCPNSTTSLTNCTSHTHLEEKCSSATMEFFENVISRHKLTKKRLQQKSSTESESDNDSCISENEY